MLTTLKQQPWVSSICLAVLASCWSAVWADEPEKYALVAGVTKYQHAEMNRAKLEYPEVDAKSLADVLRASGYTVDLLLGKEANQTAIRKKLEAFNRRANADGVALIALFGHGTEPVNTNSAYFCPFDTTLRIVRDSQGRALKTKDGKRDLLQEDPGSLIAMEELMQALKVSPAGNRVLLADCCRDDPNRARGRAFGAQLKASDIPENTAAFFACSAGEQAFEHRDWGHGAFTKCLLEEMDALASVGPVRMAAPTDRVQDRVEKLVSSQGNGRDRQSPHPFLNGKVDLQLKRATPRNDLPKQFTSKSTGMELALIPAGTFRMGSSPADVAAALKADSELKEEYLKREQPQHSVRISQPFYMGLHEVTQSEYEQVMGMNPSDFSKTGGGSDKVSGQNPGKFPVERVSWFDAVEFCNKLSVKDGLAAAYRLSNVERQAGSISKAEVTPTGAAGYRLPTEAEWEYACRAGTTTPFHFGSVLNGDQANFDGNYPFGTTTKGKSLKRPTTVGSYGANAFGLFDMHGNVWERCDDVFDESAYALRTGTTDDPLVKSGSEYRVWRGGSWFDYSGFSRAAERLRSTPDARYSSVGFRVVLSSSGVRTP